MCQPRLDPTEDETIHSMPDNLRTGGAQNKEDGILSMRNEGANALNVMSHTKEVRNSAANRMMQRLIYLKDKDSSEEDSNPHDKSPQTLRRSLTFHPDADSQPQGILPMHGRNMHQQDLEGFDSHTAVPKSSSGLFASVQAAMDPSENQERTHQSDADVQCNQIVDEVCQDAFVCFHSRFISIVKAIVTFVSFLLVLTLSRFCQLIKGLGDNWLLSL